MQSSYLVHRPVKGFDNCKRLLRKAEMGHWPGKTFQMRLCELKSAFYCQEQLCTKKRFNGSTVTEDDGLVAIRAISSMDVPKPVGHSVAALHGQNTEQKIQGKLMKSARMDL